MAFPQVTQQEAGKRAKAKPPRFSAQRGPLPPSSPTSALFWAGGGAVLPRLPPGQIAHCLPRWPIPPLDERTQSCPHFEHSQSQHNSRGLQTPSVPVLTTLDLTLGCPCLSTGHNSSNQGWPVGVGSCVGTIPVLGAHDGSQGSLSGAQG